MKLTTRVIRYTELQLANDRAVRRRDLLRKAVLLLSLSFMVLLTGCPFSDGGVELVSSEMPPSFAFRGSRDLMWIWVQGPLASDPNRPAPKLDDPKKIIIWKISPPDSKFLPLNEIPTLTYGLLPTGWKQEIPEQGAPPPMLEGFVYKIAGITSRGPQVAGMCVLIQGGKAVPYQRKGYCEY